MCFVMLEAVENACKHLSLRPSFLDHLRTNCLFVCLFFLTQGKRFLQLKNPWSHLRWKGRYSERDEKNWTPDLLKYLNFDPKMAQKFDNGKKMRPASVP